ncbi:867892e6-dbc8-46d5-bfbf-774fe39b6e0c-CDS [Sclerotinia trifoliorum]|uniref:867892e6-dbc8-46d5-bfbf-774fe39b6e0c-CDS n=1 Tax=Sclerotinia trifoliorum TaxID=28548 RepID=A0A8H2VS24_9HELO|nr:867892e6-dbc8-46d5-bfbf-774fe39b6e0c-CDS [Sclerotinia trifoliorum]
MDGNPIVGVGPMNQVQNIALWLRNSYKQRAYQIRDALIAHGNLESSFPVAYWPPSLPPDDYEDDDDEGEDEEDEDNEEVPFCLRYDEIKNYLINQKRELAIDTMKFRMPEHTLHQYIRRNGGINLSAEEWREFLLTCTERMELFHNGWSTNLATPDTQVQVNISGEQAESFFNASMIYLTDRKEPWYRLDFWDADHVYEPGCSLDLCKFWIVCFYT